MRVARVSDDALALRSRWNGAGGATTVDSCLAVRGDDLGAEVKKNTRGIVVFRPERIDESLLRLRTTEDVYLLAWGSDLAHPDPPSLHLTERGRALRQELLPLAAAVNEAALRGVSAGELGTFRAVLARLQACLDGDASP